MTHSAHAPTSATSADVDRNAGHGQDNLAHSEVLDHLSADVQKYVRQVVGSDDLSLREKAVKLYYGVRDGIFYEVYGTDVSRKGLCASAVIRSGQGFCLHKAILYAAAVRAVGIPSRILAGRVRNHLSSANLQKLVGGDVFLHWLTEIELDGVWIKATPVFNGLLCKLYGLTPLEFDGKSDSLHHPYSGNETMEFLGGLYSFDNPTYADLIELVRHDHPNMVDATGIVPGETRIGDERPLASAKSLAPAAG